MPQQQQRRRRQYRRPPLLYCPLSTRHLSYPTWVVLKTSSMPVVIKTSDLRNNGAVQALIGSDRVFPVPSVVEDIAEALPWMWETDRYPLSLAYRSVLVNLLLVCDWQSPLHIDPYSAHFRITMVVVNNILCNAFHHHIIDEAKGLVRLHLTDPCFRLFYILIIW